jgi:two-component system chemotaxis response regulator CheB
MALNRKVLQLGERIRVLVVDDSVVIRRLVTHALEIDPILQIVGTASNGSIGLQRIPLLNPDIIILDIEMPDMDGLEMLRCIRRDYPTLRVIMFSTLTERGAAITLQALTLGADDYVAKASNELFFARSIDRLQQEMIPKIRQFFILPVQSVSRPALNCGAGLVKAAIVDSPSAAIIRTKAQPRLLAIGVSTGGPNALAEILPKLPPSFPLPVLVVQHMPPLFTRLLAERLNTICQMPVEEAVQGALVQPGRILIAPGDFHMKLCSGEKVASVNLDQSPQQNFCRPAVDALFASSADVYSGAVLAVILTGMGQDGLRGVEILHARGASVIAQDEASSVVWGMPGAVVNAGLADSVLPLEDVVPEILRITGRA